MSCGNKKCLKIKLFQLCFYLYSDFSGCLFSCFLCIIYFLFDLHSKSKAFIKDPKFYSTSPIIRKTGIKRTRNVYTINFIQYDSGQKPQIS